MSTIKRMKVSIIDKDTMCAVDPNKVVIGVVGKLTDSVLVAYELREEETLGKEYEIKFLEYIEKPFKK